MLTEAPSTPSRFDHLFHHFYSPLYGLAYRMVGDAAPDVVQEAFLRLADAPVLGAPDDEVGAWLRRVCLNLGSNRLRAERRARDRAERSARLDGPTQGGATPEDAALRAEERARVRTVLAGLPERQRDCLLLRHSGHSYAEIAATLGVALGSVGVILARAERAFRENYEELHDDLP